MNNAHDTQSEYTIVLSTRNQDEPSSSLLSLSAISAPPLPEHKYLTITKDSITLLRAKRILNPPVYIFITNVTNMIQTLVDSQESNNEESAHGQINWACLLCISET